MSDKPLELISQEKRTHMCGTLRSAHIGDRVVVMGWVQTYRDLGGAIFIDLRDRTGLLQIVFEEGDDPEVHKLADAGTR